MWNMFVFVYMSKWKDNLCGGKGIMYDNRKEIGWGYFFVGCGNLNWVLKEEVD